MTSPTTAHLLSHYLATRTPRKAPTTQRGDHLYARLVGASWAHLAVAEITSAHVDDLLQDIAGRRGPALANRVRSFLCQMFKVAERRCWRPPGSNPATSAEHFRELVLTEFLTADERRRVHDAVVTCAARREITPAAGTLILLMLLGGLRWSEARELRWSEVDLERGTLRYHPRGGGDPRVRRHDGARQANKGGDQRTVPISDDVVAVLRALPRTGPVVAPNPRTGLPYVDLRKPFARVASAAQLDALRCHMMRHSFGTALAEAALTAVQIGACMGHKGPGTAHKYIHLVGGVARRALLRAAPAVRGEEVTS